jgi:hypothetical protein
MVDKITQEFRNDPNLRRQIEIKFEQFVRKLYTEMLSSNLGYCANLKVPTTEVADLFKKISSVTADEVSDAFKKQWQIPASAHQLNNPFYHYCLFFITYALRTNNDKLAKSALTLMITLLWNGRRSRLIPYCNPETMRYVISKLTKRRLFRKYDSPLSLVIDYFVPSLLKKYGDRIKNDSNVTKRLIEQAWARLHQIFIQDKAPNLQTGKIDVRRGIAAEYMAARKQGLKISSAKGMSFDDDEEGASPLEQHTTSQYEETVSNVTNYIVMNYRPKYEEWVLDLIQKESKVNRKAIQIFINNLHSIKFNDYIREIVNILSTRLQVVDRNICGRNFLTDEVRRKIISSKNTPDISQLQKIIDLLIGDIFKHAIKHINYEDYTAPTRGKFRKVIIYIIAYNIQKYICFASK